MISEIDTPPFIPDDLKKLREVVSPGVQKTKSPKLYDRAVIHTTVPRLSMAMRPQKRSTLDENNAKWSAQNKQLHPTKGWRKISVKKTLIADMTARMMWGNIPLMKAVLQ